MPGTAGPRYLEQRTALTFEFARDVQSADGPSTRVGGPGTLIQGHGCQRVVAVDKFPASPGKHGATMKYPSAFPKPQGLYHPRNERDACGIGFVAHI